MTYTKEMFTRDTKFSHDTGMNMVIDDQHFLIRDGENLNFARVTDGCGDSSYVISRNTLDYDYKSGNWDETLIGFPAFDCPETVDEVIDFLNKTNF